MRSVPIKMLGLILLPLWLISDHCYGNTTKVLMVGDSLSAAYQMESNQGWIAKLQTKLHPSNILLINAAVSGDTTDGGLARLPRLLNTHKPSHVYIELGGNDGLQGHSTKKIYSNLEKMVALIRKHNAIPLLQSMRIPTNYGARYNRMFNGLYERLAAEQEVQLIPFFLDEIALKPELMMADGIHPKAEAQPLIAEIMYQHFHQLANTTTSE